MAECLNERISLHKKFWSGEDLDRIPVSFRIGDYFFARKFTAAHRLLNPGKKIEANMLDVDSFIEDYERIYAETEELGQDGFWAAEPFTAIPWMEAILGCSVFAADHSFVSEPGLSEGEFFPKIDDLEQNPWYRKYMEFTAKLVSISKGRFPVGQPIMRGPSDMMGALLGQTRLIYEMNDEPEKIRQLAEIVTNTFRNVISEQFKLIPDFKGGTSMGFYHLWAPGKSIWFQEDLSALLSPAWYRDFIMQRDIEICKPYKYTAVHLHPVSFHILDDLLNIKELKVIEVNKDVGGPSVSEMMPVFNRIISAGKGLVIWGDIDEKDIGDIKRELPRKSIFLNIVAEDAGKAKKLRSMLEY